MELGALDRIILLGLLPREDVPLTIKIVRKLKEELSFSEEEHKALTFEQTAEQLKWNNEGDKPKEIVIGEKAMDIIMDSLKAVVKNKKFTEPHLILCEHMGIDIEKLAPGNS